MKNYQKILSTVLLISAAIYSAGCKKKDNTETAAAYICTTCVTTPDAKAENNASSKGIYKGVVNGSTGNITIDILNSSTIVKALLVLDGTTINLTSTTAWVTGVAYNADFTGTSGGQTFSLRFTVDAFGSNPIVSALIIPGHPIIAFQVYKETSDNLIKSYEGATEGVKDNGNAQGSVLNIVISGKSATWIGLSKDNTSSAVGVVTGTVSGNTINCNCGTATSLTATITSDDLIGTYKGSDNHGTIKARRTL